MWSYICIKGPDLILSKLKDPDYDPEYDPRDDPNSHYYEPEWDDYYWWKKQKNRDKTVAFKSGPDLISSNLIDMYQKIGFYIPFLSELRVVSKFYRSNKKFY